MNEPKPPTPRERLQKLLLIPERQRTDAEWDEIHELELDVMNAAGRTPNPVERPRNIAGHNKPPHHHPQQQPQQQRHPHGKKQGQGRRPQRKPPKP